MARNSRQQDKRRARRQERLRELRREKSGSPYRRIGQHGELKACYLSRGWKERGMGTLLCLRAAPGGSHALAAFLIDFWCIGLKDAWGRLDMSMEEFQQLRSRALDAGDELVRVELDVAKRLLAGSIRFAEENGFRLPARHERWVALLGGLGDVESADLGDFGVDGRLRYVGTEDDLRKRLARATVEDFLRRRDVEFILGPGKSILPDDEETGIETTVGVLREAVVGAAREWCFAQGSAPHPRLGDAWDLMAEAMMQAPDPGAGDAQLEETCAGAADNMERFLDLHELKDQRELAAAMEKLRAFMSTFGSLEEMFAGLGLEDETDEE